MRRITFFVCLILAGCANAVDSGKSASTAVTNLRSAFGADIDLEAALLKDISWKSAQLDFISLGRYSCGDPTHPYWRMATTIEWTDEQRDRDRKHWDDKKKKVEERLLKNFDELEVIINYGEFLVAMNKWFTNINASAEKVQKIIDNTKKYAVGETDALVVAIEAGLNLVRTSQLGAHTAALHVMALSVEKPLENAVKKLSSDDSIKALTASEVLAFNYWDACARERLRFLRDFNPKLLGAARFRTDRNVPPYLAARLEGEAPTPVLQFAHEFKTYLEEREAFIGRRPDYRSLLAAIVKANHAIAYPKSGEELSSALDAISFWSQQLPSINDASEKLRISVEKYRSSR